MADYLRPVGFWSYTSTDDEASGGRLSQLRRLLARHLQLRIGRQKVHIFQDIAAIQHGTNWLKEIHKALDESFFFIPIVTPAFLQSKMCCREVIHFREREAALGRDDLIFPLRYIDVSDIDPAHGDEVCDLGVFHLLRERQHIDFTTLRLRALSGVKIAVTLDHFAGSLRGALRRNAMAPAAPAKFASDVVTAPEQGQTVPVPLVLASPRLRGAGHMARSRADLPDMVQIPAGTFVMGVPEDESRLHGTGDEDARPAHTVTFAKPFWLGRYPVTRGEFAGFVAETGYKTSGQAWTFERDANGDWAYALRNGRGWHNPGFAQTDRHPVVCVSYDDAVAYTNWLSRKTGQRYRLPSEAEWEYAARAGTQTARFWGDDPAEVCRYANVADRSLMEQLGRSSEADRASDCNDGFSFTSPVGSFPPNAFGLHDMLGNVWEWTADCWHETYASAPCDGSEWKAGGVATRRVLRGGSWDDDRADVRAGHRLHYGHADRVDDVGFRVARTSF